MLADWTLGLRLWLERSGQAILGPGRLELLEWIDRCHSISAAARQMRMSYRRAWLLVDSINTAAGEELVARKTGGAKGGGATLTETGRLAVSVFGDLQDQLRRSAAALLPRLLPAGSGRSAVHVAAAVSLEEVLGRLATDFALQNPAVEVRFVYGASDELAEHVLSGATVNLFIGADSGPLERLRRAGLIHGPDTQLAENSLAAIAADAWAGSLRKPADLCRPAIKRLAVAAPSCPLGRYTRLFLEKERLLKRVEARLLPVDNSRAVIAAVRSGQAPVGLIYGSDVTQAASCRLLFRVRHAPAAIQYRAALVHTGPPPDAARSFLEFLASGPAMTRFRQCGFLAPD